MTIPVLKRISQKGQIQNKEHKNFCSRLYKKEHKKYFDTVDFKKISDNKALWKNIEPLFSEKRKFANEITLEDSEENVISDNTTVPEKLINKNYKINDNKNKTIKTPNINGNSYFAGSGSSITNPVNKAINAYKNHLTILLMKQQLENLDHFSFKKVSLNETEKELRQLNQNKATTFGNKPTKILNQSNKSCSGTLQKLFIDALRDSSIPDKLKCTNEVHVFKKDDPAKAKYYRPLSILPGVSKIFDRLMHKQISFCIDQFLFSYMCG